MELNNFTRQIYDNGYSKPNPNITTYLDKIYSNNIPDYINKLLTYPKTYQTEISSNIELTNLRENHQYKVQPYVGHYSGPGTRSNDNIDLETALIQGVSTNSREKSCFKHRNAPLGRFNCLPEYGNPQRVEKIIFPTTRGGDHTRDYVRRVDYYRRANGLQTQII